MVAFEVACALFRSVTAAHSADDVACALFHTAPKLPQRRDLEKANGSCGKDARPVVS